MTTGENLKKMRKAAGLTQRELGARLGVTSAHISAMELDQKKPSHETLMKIVREFGCDAESLIGSDHVTRADKWRSMTDEEIAMAIYENDKVSDMFCKNEGCGYDDMAINHIKCFLCCLRWLKEEA